jgi:hypothetical protein
MQKPTKYHEFFNFFLLTPAVILEGYPVKEIVDDMLSNLSIPISCITNQKDPMLQGIKTSFEKQGITEPIKVIILSIEYNKQFLA